MNAGKSSCGGMECYYSVLFNKDCRVSAVSGSFVGISEHNSSWGTLRGGNSGFIHLPRQPKMAAIECGTGAEKSIPA